LTAIFINIFQVTHYLDGMTYFSCQNGFRDFSPSVHSLMRAGNQCCRRVGVLKTIEVLVQLSLYVMYPGNEFGWSFTEGLL